MIHIIWIHWWCSKVILVITGTTTTTTQICSIIIIIVIAAAVFTCHGHYLVVGHGFDHLGLYHARRLQLLLRLLLRCMLHLKMVLITKICYLNCAIIDLVMIEFEVCHIFCSQFFLQLLIVVRRMLLVLMFRILSSICRGVVITLSNGFFFVFLIEDLIFECNRFGQLLWWATRRSFGLLMVTWIVRRWPTTRLSVNSNFLMIRCDQTSMLILDKF